MVSAVRSGCRTAALHREPKAGEPQREPQRDCAYNVRKKKTEKITKIWEKNISEKLRCVLWYGDMIFSLFFYKTKLSNLYFSCRWKTFSFGATLDAAAACRDLQETRAGTRLAAALHAVTPDRVVDLFDYLHELLRGLSCWFALLCGPCSGCAAAPTLPGTDHSQHEPSSFNECGVIEGRLLRLGTYRPKRSDRRATLAVSHLLQYAHQN